MIGEIDYEIVVGAIHNLLTIVFFIAVFVCGFSSSLFVKEGPYCLPFMNMLYMMGNLDCFPTRRWGMLAYITLDIVGRGGL